LRQTIEWFRDQVPLSDEVLESLTPRSWEQEKAEEWMMAL
jgi:hypothetical protein